MKHFIIAIAAAVTAAGAAAGIFDGPWKGTVAGKIPVVFNIINDSTATLSSPSQGAMDIPCDRTVADAATGSLTIELRAIGMKFEGKLEPDSSAIKGTFVQGMAMPLTLVRASAEDLLPPRPQTPKPPFFYNTEEVTFHNGDITLAGTLSTPAVPRKGGFKAVVLVTGSGTQNRDEEILGHKPFAVIADYLTRCGYAVLRYDDRGAGKSSPGRPGDTTADYAADARAALDYLRSRPEVNPDKAGILGHSEGALVAFMNAADTSAHVAFVISLAGPAVEGKQIMVEQNEMIASLAGQPLSDETRAAVTELFDAIATENDSTVLAARVRDITRRIHPELSDEQIAAQTQAMLTPWYIGFVRTDPRPILSRITCPVLALNGTWDVQVNADTNLGSISELVPSATVMPLDGLNHLFQEAPSQEASFNYGAITQTISPEVLSLIAGWMNKL